MARDLRDCTLIPAGLTLLAVCDEFSEGTKNGVGIGGGRVGTTVCKNWYCEVSVV